MPAPVTNRVTPDVDRVLRNHDERLRELVAKLERRRTRIRIWPGSAMTGVTTGNYSTVTKSAEGILSTDTATTSVQLPVPMEVGERLEGVRALVIGTAAARISLTTRRQHPEGGAAAILGVAVSNSRAGIELLQQDVRDTVLDLPIGYFVRFSFNTASGQQVVSIVVLSSLPGVL